MNNPRHKLTRVEKEASLSKRGQAAISHARTIRGPLSIVLGVEELMVSETQSLHTHLGQLTGCRHTGEAQEEDGSESM